MPRLSPAVLRCWTAYEQAYAVARGKGQSHLDASHQGITAYRDAIPILSDLAAIRDFVACIKHGMALQLIPKDEGATFLSGAGLAAGAHRREATAPGEPKKAKSEACVAQAAD